MKKSIRTNEEVEKMMQSILDHFAKEEMSKAEFLQLAGGQNGKARSLNVVGMWGIALLRPTESGEEKTYNFSIGLQCPHCENLMTYDPKLWGNGAWFCEPCDSGVSCFKGTCLPVGVPTFSKGRALRIETKKFVNAMVEKAKASRYDAHKYVYYWMTKKLGYNPEETFITLASVSTRELNLLQQYISEWLRSDNPSKIDDLFNFD